MSLKHKLKKISTTINSVFYELSSEYNETSILMLLDMVGRIKLNKNYVIDNSVLNERQLTIMKEIESTLIQKERVMDSWLDLERIIESKAKDIMFCLYNGEKSHSSCKIFNIESAIINLIAEQREVLREPLNVSGRDRVVDEYADYLEDKLSDWTRTDPCPAANRVFDALLDKNLAAASSIYQSVLAKRAATSIALNDLPKPLY